MLEAGQDILYLAFSSGLSGTCQASCVAARMLQEKFPGRRIACVDSRQASMGEGLFAYLVGRRRLAAPVLTRRWPTRSSWLPPSAPGSRWTT